MRYFYDKMIYIQKKLMNKLESKRAKVEVMLTYWDKVYGKLQTISSKRGDKKGNCLLCKICCVPKEVKLYVLREYIAKCMELHSIAFLQWRARYPNKVRHDPEEIRSIISDRLSKLYEQSSDKFFITEKTKSESVISKDFLKVYGLIECHYKDYQINSFRSIGWADPYPNDDQFITGSLDDGYNLRCPESPDDLVYQEQRYIKGNSPICQYIPRKEIMLKIMRACVGIKTPQDLWFN